MTISIGFSLADAGGLSKGLVSARGIQGRMNRRCLLKEAE